MVCECGGVSCSLDVQYVFGVYGLGLEVWGLDFGVCGLGFRV